VDGIRRGGILNEWPGTQACSHAGEPIWRQWIIRRMAPHSRVGRTQTFLYRSWWRPGYPRRPNSLLAALSGPERVVERLAFDAEIPRDFGRRLVRCQGKPDGFTAENLWIPRSTTDRHASGACVGGQHKVSPGEFGLWKQSSEAARRILRRHKSESSVATAVRRRAPSPYLHQHTSQRIPRTAVVAGAHRAS
jgi:hypothetical protein